MAGPKRTHEATLDDLTAGVAEYVAAGLVNAGLNKHWLDECLAEDGMVFGRFVHTPTCAKLGWHRLQVVPVADGRVVLLCTDENCTCGLLDRPIGPMSFRRAVAFLREEEESAAREELVQQGKEYVAMLVGGARGLLGSVAERRRRAQGSGR